MTQDEVNEIHWMTSTEILENEKAPLWLKESTKKAGDIKLRIERGI